MSDKKPVARREVKVAIAYPPFVSLLPPEVGHRKAAARARGRAVFLAIIALAIAILAAGAANVYALQRAVSLENARTLTRTLTEQQAEYSEVRSANQLLQSTESARKFAHSTEVSVKKLIDGLSSKLSSGMKITEIRFATANPLQAFGQGVSPLDPESMGTFSMEVQGSSVAAIDAWVRKAADVDGITDATLVSVRSSDDGVFTASVVVFVNSNALLHRFDGVVIEPEEEEAPAPEETPSPTTTPEPTPGTNDEEDGS